MCADLGTGTALVPNRRGPPPCDTARAMSQKNVDVMSFYNAWNRGDLDRAVQALDPDIELCLPEGGINAGIYRGHNAVRGYWRAT